MAKPAVRLSAFG